MYEMPFARIGCISWENLQVFPFSSYSIISFVGGLVGVIGVSLG